jgi:hypothetical protein
MKTKQKMIGISEETKTLLDQNYKVRGYGTRSKYIKALILKDILPPYTPPEDTEENIPENPYI